jgi:hypothetical protein
MRVLAAISVVLTLVVGCEQQGSQMKIATPEEAISKARDAWAEFNANGTYGRTFAASEIARFEPYTAILDGTQWKIVGSAATNGDKFPATYVN